MGNREPGPRVCSVLRIVGGHASTEVQRSGCEHAKGSRDVVLVARGGFVTHENGNAQCSNDVRVNVEGRVARRAKRQKGFLNKERLAETVSLECRDYSMSRQAAWPGLVRTFMVDPKRGRVTAAATKAMGHKLF